MSSKHKNTFTQYLILNTGYPFIILEAKMFDTTQAKKEFVKLDHKTKLNKVKESLEILSRKSSFFADLRNHFKSQKDIQENALDAMYAMVMNLVYNGQRQ